MGKIEAIEEAFRPSLDFGVGQSALFFRLFGGFFALDEGGSLGAAPFSKSLTNFVIKDFEGFS